MKEVPLDLDMDLSSTVEANKDFHFKINYFSNVDWLLTDLRVNIDYPSGYAFSQSTPKSLDKNEWSVPVLNKNQSGIIDVTGQLSGEFGRRQSFPGADRDVERRPVCAAKRNRERHQDRETHGRLSAKPSTATPITRPSPGNGFITKFITATSAIANFTIW